MNWNMIFCIGWLVILIIVGIGLLIYWVSFKKEYHESVARYIALMEKADIDDINNIYNKEYPADFPGEGWTKGDKDDG